MPFEELGRIGPGRGAKTGCERVCSGQPSHPLRLRRGSQAKPMGLDRPITLGLKKMLLDVYCVVNTTHMAKQITFGQFLRESRETRAVTVQGFSLRKVAERVGIEPSYLSKIERDEQPPPGETVIRQLAVELSEDPDVMLGLAGKVSSDLLAIIRSRPRLFADLIRQLKHMPDHAVLRIVREVRDGNW
jgi:HTH-type transcriptional regulator, competence development regulator